jgi:hypothetical protein
MPGTGRRSTQEYYRFLAVRIAVKGVVTRVVVSCVKSGA